MLWSLEAVRDNIRNRDGKRVFYLVQGDQLTSSARDYLTAQRIEILPAAQARPQRYRLQGGGWMEEKPEHMTHLNGDTLVPKTHTRIVFRGAMDTLEAELLLSQLEVSDPIRKDLGEVLALARDLVRWEVLGEPVEERKLCGLTQQEQRLHSHRPQDFYGQPHFMPQYTDGMAILQLNRARCAARAAELAAARAFVDEEGNVTRPDLLRALNRMSSMIWILMIRLKKDT